MPSPRRRATELVQKLDANGIEQLRTLLAELNATQDRATALDDANTAVLAKPQAPE